MPESLVDQLIRHEGLRLRMYTDTRGKVTIGVGRNLTDCGISKDEALQMLAADVTAAATDLATFPWYRDLNEARRQALIDLRFNLGPTKFRGFARMLRALSAGDYLLAADEMRDSKWFHDVGYRAVELAAMVRTGRFAEEITV